MATKKKNGRHQVLYPGTSIYLRILQLSTLHSFRTFYSEDVQIKEITVDEHSDVAGETDESEEGEVAEDEDMEEGEVEDEENPEEEDGKRAYDEEGDEESSSMTPPNEGTYRKRRRF